MRPIDQAVADVRAVTDPYQRIDEADRLDTALATARSVVAQIKRDTINSLRTPTHGYGSISERLGLTKGRVQQIANAPRKFSTEVAYAFRDEHGNWYGEPDLLLEGAYREAPTPRPFSPADKYNPLWGQTLTVRCGPVPEDGRVSLYTLHVRVLGGDGNERPVRTTHPVDDALFGPPIVTTPEHKKWQEAREQRRLELEGS